jgi:hypothetical protein
MDFPSFGWDRTSSKSCINTRNISTEGFDCVPLEVVWHESDATSCQAMGHGEKTGMMLLYQIRRDNYKPEAISSRLRIRKRR